MISQPEVCKIHVRVELREKPVGVNIVLGGISTLSTASIPDSGGSGGLSHVRLAVGFSVLQASVIFGTRSMSTCQGFEEVGYPLLQSNNAVRFMPEVPSVCLDCHKSRARA